MIMLNQVLKDMCKVDHKGRPVPFSIQFCTASKKRRTGGELIDLPQAVLSWNQKKGASKSEPLPEGKTAIESAKKPNHYRNRTRNLVLPNGEMRKVHISLITRFNGHEVI